MIWSIIPEISLSIGLILIILYGLYSLSASSPMTAGHIATSNASFGVGNQMSNKYSASPLFSEGKKAGSPAGFANLQSSEYEKQTAKMANLYLSDFHFFSSLWPIMLFVGYALDYSAVAGSSLVETTGYLFAYQYNGLDFLLAVLTVIIMQSFKSIESLLLLKIAFVGQLFMLHSCDLVSFYICLEAQNFAFLILCGLQPRAFKYEVLCSHKTVSRFSTEKRVGVTSLPPVCEANWRSEPSFSLEKAGFAPPVCEANGSLAVLPLAVKRLPASVTTSYNLDSNSKVRGSRPLAGVEASIKYLLLSAFSSGVLLFWFSISYLRTGMTSLDSVSHGLTSVSFDINQSDSFMNIIPQMLILIALMFKLGAAPLHLWMIDIYSGVKRQLLMYIGTAPKLSLFGFWVTTWHSVWTDLTVFIFVALSMIIGCFGAYNQPSLRSLFAYSTINEIGLMLMAIETAGFHTLFQHLSIYIVTMLLLWNISDKRLFTILAISLAGMPPLAGFFGKAWIFGHVANASAAGPYLGLLVISLFCTGLALVYYLRLFRLFTMGGLNTGNNIIYPAGVDGNVSLEHIMCIDARTYSDSYLDRKIALTSLCVIFLMFAPLFYLKPFVL